MATILNNGGHLCETSHSIVCLKYYINHYFLCISPYSSLYNCKSNHNLSRSNHQLIKLSDSLLIN